MTETVLVVVAHPDDEVLGCGATIARHVSEGRRVCVLYLADGVGARNHPADKAPADSSADLRRRMACDAAGILGVSEVEFADFPDNRFDSVDLLNVVQRIECSLRKWRPGVVYTHYCYDLNIDHRVVHEAVLTACRPQPGFFVDEILSFEVCSSTRWRSPVYPAFSPSVFVRIDEPAAELKFRALNAYQTEMRPWPHERSLEALEVLMRHRGAQVGVELAEAFVQERRLL